MAVKREYLMLAMVTIFLSAGSGIALWAGAFTNAKIQLKEATCIAMLPGAIQSFNDAPVSSWKPAGAQIRDITEIYEAASFKSPTGDVLERRCRGNATMVDGTHSRVVFKLYESEGKALPLVGIGYDSEMRIFRRG